MDNDALTIHELENSGYNEAASFVEADPIAAAHMVLDRPSVFVDDEDKRVRRKASGILVDYYYEDDYYYEEED